MDTPRNLISLTSGVQGWYKLEAIKTDSSGVPIESTRRIIADWFPNLITNAGLDRLGAEAAPFPNCQVGIGNTAPSVSDTQLANRVASTTQSSTTTGSSSSAPYYGWCRIKYRFDAGVATGTLAEVGVGWASTGSLYSRSLIVDAQGPPTTVTVQPSEVLDVTYEHRIYAPTSDANNQVTINGTTYTFTTRPLDVTGNSWRFRGDIHAFSSSSATWNAYDATGLTASTNALPAGSPSAFVSAPSVSAYSNGTYYRDHTCVASTDGANVSGGIDLIVVSFGSNSTAGRFQYLVTPAIQKTSSQSLALTIRQTWARKTI